MSKNVHFHGSDIESAAAYYNIPKESIVSFGANVNPLGLSKHLKEKIATNLDILSSYPDRNYCSLKNVIGEYCDVSPEHIIVGNGSTELISLLIQSRAPKKALLLSPTYSEYERELALADCTLDYYNLNKDNMFELSLDDFCSTIENGYDLVIICNPNNPTGSALTTVQIDHILDACTKSDCFVMIDETYVEFAPDISLISATSLVKKHNNLMVLRGTSKFFAAPGLRFGYGATSNQEFLRTLIEKQNPWSLNSLAAYAGELMLTDHKYIQQTHRFISEQRDMMYKRLSECDNIKVYPSLANFILVEILSKDLTSYDVFDHLMKQGLMVRDCSSFEALDGEFFRFCIMSEDDNERLISAIIEFFQ